MRSLVYLQEGVLTDDKSIVSNYIDDLDLKTSNDEMIKAGEKFGFKTVKVYEKVYGGMAEISRVLGYGDPSSYRRLLEKWEIYTPSIGGFGNEYRMLFCEKLGFHENDGRSLLVDWIGFLIGGVKGEGENADEVLVYLLRREREARINAVTVDQVKAEELLMKKEIHKVKMLKERLSLIKAVGAKIPPLLKAEFTALTGVVIPDDGQLELPFKS